MAAAIKIDTEQEMLDIIDTRLSLGKFYFEDKVANLTIGVDNSDGDAWTEEFPNEKDCLEWLNGINDKLK